MKCLKCGKDLKEHYNYHIRASVFTCDCGEEYTLDFVEGYDVAVAHFKTFKHFKKIDKILEERGHLVDWNYRNTKEHQYYVNERMTLAKAIYKLCEKRLLSRLIMRNLMNKKVERKAMKYQVCPVCEGRGIVPSGFYSYPKGQEFISTSAAPEPCRRCGGAGTISGIIEAMAKRMPSKKEIADEIDKTKIEGMLHILPDDRDRLAGAIYKLYKRMQT